MCYMEIYRDEKCVASGITGEPVYRLPKQFVWPLFTAVPYSWTSLSPEVVLRETGSPE